MIRIDTTTGSGIANPVVVFSGQSTGVYGQL
jgi:hypothetical protein